MSSVWQDVHAGLQHESAHRPRAQQAQAVAVSVLWKELCNYKWPETALVKVVHLKLHIYNANNKFKVMGWERSISVKTVGENSQTGILQFFTGDQIKGRIKQWLVLLKLDCHACPSIQETTQQWAHPFLQRVWKRVLQGGKLPNMILPIGFLVWDLLSLSMWPFSGLLPATPCEESHRREALQLWVLWTGILASHHREESQEGKTCYFVRAPLFNCSSIR